MKYLLIILLPLLRASCSGRGESERASDKKAASNQVEVYDYRDERYQDFYSRYMRKTGKHYLIFKPQDVQKKLGIENIPDNVYGRMNVYRTEPYEIGDPPMSRFKNQKDVEKYYNENLNAGGELSSVFRYEYCDGADQEKNLFCIKNPSSEFVYFYFPNKEPGLKYIDHSIHFFFVINTKIKKAASYLLMLAMVII